MPHSTDHDDLVPAADAYEQRRPLLEQDVDPEQTAEWPQPDGSSTEVDPADAQDQTIEVPHDHDDEYVEP